MSHTHLQDRYQLKIQLLHLERQAEEAAAALRQAKFDLREAKAAQIEYSGSFKSLRDKLTGKKEETETTLRHTVQKAETALSSAQRQKELLESRLSGLKTQLSSLPDWKSLNDGSTQWYRLEALYCTEVLEPLLDANRELLLARRNQFNGSNVGIKSYQTLAEIYSAPEAAGEAAKPYLLRLKAASDALDTPFELHHYFQNPTGFLSSATQYTRMERINTAIAQVEAMQRLLPKLRNTLSE